MVFVAWVAPVFCMVVVCVVCAQACPLLAVIAGGVGIAHFADRARRSPQFRSQAPQQPAAARQAAAPLTGLPSVPATTSSPYGQAFQGYSATAPPPTAPSVEMQGARTMQVQCPKGTKPGQLVEFTTPDGKSMQVPVPIGVEPGQIFSCAY
eukprot:TRINITY_DN27079_c0_g1_i1.p1 TRINITY_DN27079_c0_g1~~TRINITY_DN27079_c0_g1_i1.p1  ORF type:complete len:151 (-),score=16.44 TRINITY_DN27079_c0_g1_i1:164-616(-)